MRTPIPTSKPHYGARGATDPLSEEKKLGLLTNRAARGNFLIRLAGIAWLLLAAVLSVRGQSPPNCTGSGLGISLFADVADAGLGDTIRYSALVFNTPFPACDASSIQAAIVTPDGLTNTITLRRTALVPGDSDFYTNVVAYIVRAQDILLDGTVRATAFDSGDIHQNDVLSRGGGFQGVNTQIVTPCIDITAQCTGGVGENGTITFTGTIKNCGNRPLTSVTVTNQVNGGSVLVFGPVNLAINESASFSGSWVPANPCAPSTATLVATGTSALTLIPRVVTKSVSITCSVVTTPGIVVSHDCPANAPAAGQSGTFAGTVSNSGNVTLNNVTVRSGESTVYGPATLAPGASANFTGTFSAPADTCSVTTTVTATGVVACNDQSISSTSTKSCPVATTPRLAITKSCPTTPVAAGGQITFSGNLQNLGNVTLTDVVVNRGTDRVFGPVTLAPGASTSFTASSTVPNEACSYTETWVATGRDQCSGATVSENATSTCPVTSEPKVDLSLSCPSGQLNAGTTTKINGTVQNQGTVGLNNVVVVNNAIPGTPVFTVATLAPGASASFTADIGVPIDGCSVSASFTASASSECEGAVTDTASVTCAVATSPALTVTHNCPETSASPGQSTSYTGRVSNTGNVTLKDVVVLNSLSGTQPVFGPISLAPGQSADFTASYSIAETSQDCSYESHVTATGADQCTGQVVSAEHRTTCTLQFASGLEITFICDSTPASQGEEFHYNAIIKNVGRSRLENINVTDSHHGTDSVWSRDSLSVGESHEFHNFATVPPNCCSITTTLHATAVDSCTQQPVEDTSGGTCPILYHPKIEVSQECPSRPLVIGEESTFTGSVSNPGDVTLIDVNVFNNNVDSEESNHILGPIILAPGQVVNFKATYVVPGTVCGEGLISATGRAYCGTNDVVSASASSKCEVETEPWVVVSKQCPTLPVAPGEIFAFTGTVSNAGNVTLTNVVVLNSKPSAGTHVFGPVTLTPGQSLDFAGSYILDAPCEDTFDTLTVSATDQCTGQTVENSATALCPVLRSPRIDVTVGEENFTGQVRNTGDVALKNVTVSTEASGRKVQLLGPISLAPGAIEKFSGTSSDGVVTAQGVSTCKEISVTASATSAGPVTTPLSIDKCQLNAGQVTLNWKSVSGRFYRVEYKNSLTAEWQPVAGAVQALQGTAEKVDSLGTDTQRFYRVILVE